MAYRQKPLDKSFDCSNPGGAYGAGIDEAGRGCLAGPVVAAAVILPPVFSLPLLTDSKLLRPAVREKLEKDIRKVAVAWGIGVVGPKTIDKINILQASLLAMARACKKLAALPQFLLIDGKFVIPESYFSESLSDGKKRAPSQKAIVGGDKTEPAISAASILAKTWRDRLMLRYQKIWPQYGFAKHKGYGTREHLKAIAQFGPTPIHRMSFHGVRNESAPSELFLFS